MVERGWTLVIAGASDYLTGLQPVVAYAAALGANVKSYVWYSPTAFKDKGYEVKTGVFPLSASGRAMTLQQTDGFVKMVVEKDTDLLLGVHILGPHASDMLGEASLALEMAATAEMQAIAGKLKYALIVIASIPPLVTVWFERWATRTGALGAQDAVRTT